MTMIFGDPPAKTALFSNSVLTYAYIVQPTRLSESQLPHLYLFTITLLRMKTLG